MPEHQVVQKRTQKYKASRTKGEICGKRVWRQKKKCGKSEKKLSGRKSASLCWRTRSSENRMADAEMEAELQGLQAGEERRGSNASQAVDCCLETMVEQVIAMRTDQGRSTFDAWCKIFVGKFETSISPAQMQGREGGRRDSENEQDQGRANQQLMLPTPSGVNRDAPASSLELDRLCVVKAEVQEEQVSKEIEREDHPDHQNELLWRKTKMTMWEDWCLKQKRKGKQPGKGPKNL